MICENCKIREATIQYTEVVNGVKTEHHFCAQCAQEMNFEQLSLFNIEFPLSRILSGLLAEAGKEEESEYARIVCPNCGTGYRDFVEASRFGCPECYEVFDILVRDSIRQLQGSEQHKGKKPKYGCRMVPENLAKELPGSMNPESGSPERKTENKDGNPNTRVTGSGALVELRRKLKEAVSREDYEQAAKYRDEIKALEKEEPPDA